MLLTTERLRLALPELEDARAMYEAAQDPDLPLNTTLPFPYRREDADAFVALSAEHWASGQAVNWAIHAPEGFAGVVGVRLHGTAGEIGFWVAAPVRGLGYTTEASAAVIDWAFSAAGLGLRRLEWRARVGNVASARVAQKVGFRYEGLLRQALTSPIGPCDGWVAGLLVGDDREPQPWPIELKVTQP